MQPCQNNILSENSTLYSQLTKANPKIVGKVHPISLPSISIDRVINTIGKKINNGQYGFIYEVKDCKPPRVYKVIPQNIFKDGNEILISKIAGAIGVGPAVYSAFLVEHDFRNEVFIEMDETGKCLGQLEDVKPSNKEKVVFSKEIEQILEQLASEDPYKTIKTETKCLPSIDPINKLYKNPEEFYFALFTKIKTLAINNISYRDSNYGNIIPNQETTKELLLVDFGGAELMSDIKTATERSFQSLYNQLLMEDFLKIPALSKDSRELIEWFIEQSESLRAMLAQNKSLSHFLKPYLSKAFPILYRNNLKNREFGKETL